jgi:hypothetical protein
MRWILRDGPVQLVLSTERGAPFEGALLVDDATSAASTLRELSYDPENMKILRHVHAELVAAHNARSRADTLLLAELMGQVAARRLFLFEPGRSYDLTYDVRSAPAEDDGVWEDAEPLLTNEPPPPEPEPEAPPSPAVLAQAAALRQAARSGAPFCEE